MTFIVEIDPDTLRESEAAREIKANMAKEPAWQCRKERYASRLTYLHQQYASMTPEQRAAVNARRRQRRTQMTTDQRKEYNACRQQRCAQMTTEQRDDHSKRQCKRYRAMAPEKKVAYLAEQKAYRDGLPCEKREQQRVQRMLAERKRAAERSPGKIEAIRQRKALRQLNLMEEQAAKDAESKQKSAAKLKAGKFDLSAPTTKPTERDILTDSGWGAGQQGNPGNVWYDGFMSKKIVAYNSIDRQKQRTDFSLK
jgi:hypothetical protein